MKLISILSALLASFTIISASPLFKPGLDTPLRSGRSKKCAKQLEQIVYSPSNPAKDYLLKIAREIALEVQQRGDKLDSVATLKVLAMNADRYRVNIEVQPVFSNTPNLLIQPGNAFSATPRVIGQVITPTYLSMPGFNYDSKTGFYSLAIYVPSIDGTGYTIILFLDAENNTFFECK